LVRVKAKPVTAAAKATSRQWILVWGIILYMTANKKDETTKESPNCAIVKVINVNNALIEKNTIAE